MLLNLHQFFLVSGHEHPIGGNNKLLVRFGHLELFRDVIGFAGEDDVGDVSGIKVANLSSQFCHDFVKF